MDKKALAGIGIIAVGGIAVLMMSRSSAGPSLGGSGGGGAPPPVTKKESLDTGTETVTEIITETPISEPAPIYNIIFESPFGGSGGAGGFGGSGGAEIFPDPVDTIADTLYPKDPARKVYASTRLPSYRAPDPPTKKEQNTAERGFTSRTGGGEGDIWIGGR